MPALSLAPEMNIREECSARYPAAFIASRSRAPRATRFATELSCRLERNGVLTPRCPPQPLARTELMLSRRLPRACAGAESTASMHASAKSLNVMNETEPGPWGLMSNLAGMIPAIAGTHLAGGVREQ
jgi:hypothetical protein